MPSILIQHRFPAASGVNRDTVVMDFAFQAPTTSVGANMQAFFNVKPTGATFSLAAWLSPWLSRAANLAEQLTYDLTNFLGGQPTLGAPIGVNLWTLGATAQAPLPQEICCALSIHALDNLIPEHGPGTRPKSRYRGRVYLGPLGNSVLATASGNRAQVNTVFRADVALIANALLAAEPSWGVFSRKDRIVRPIIGGWIDDDFDVQRRRGTDSTVRTNFGGA